MIVFDRDGNFLRSWGEGMFPRAHGVHMAPDDTIFCTDDGAHCVRKCTLDGKVLMTIGVPGKPAPFMSGQPFCRCTHTALSPKGEIYVTDGYGNAQVHKYTPDGKYLSRGASAASARASSICRTTSIAMPTAGSMSRTARTIASRCSTATESSRRMEQVVHRPSALHMTTGRARCASSARSAPIGLQPRLPQPRPAHQHPVQHRQAPGAPRLREQPARPGAGPVHVAARHRGGFARRHLCRRGVGGVVAIAVSGAAETRQLRSLQKLVKVE